MEAVSYTHLDVYKRQVYEITHITQHLLANLSTTVPAKDREVEAAKARARNAIRFGTPA